MARSILRSAAGLLAACAAASVAAQSTPYIDPSTGITFQGFTHEASGSVFGLALPKDPNSTDLIGQIRSASADGWAGLSLGNAMVGRILVVAYPNGRGNITASLREAAAFATPPPYTGSGARLRAIPSGISVTGTSFTYTFLCEGCIFPGKSFSPADAASTLGFARSTRAVSSPTSPESALNFHGGGYGLFQMDIAGAKSTSFAQWAALAGAGGGGPGAPGEPGNPGNNGTLPISDDTWDYIVVGSGPAGLISATRLAESGVSVLLLERGGPSTYSSGGKLVMPWNDTRTVYDVPAMAFPITAFPNLDGFCDDTAGQAGCILGGGSAVNGMIFIRPPAIDFDENFPEGWKWKDVEAAAARVYERNPATHVASMDGKQYDMSVWDVLSVWLKSVGWKFTSSLENPHEKKKVYSHAAMNAMNGIRAGGVQTYLPIAQRLPNFKLQLNTKVIRVDRKGSKATGVEVQLPNGKRQLINLTKNGRILLAAGSMSSPRILFNSGIGPKAQLDVVRASSAALGVRLVPEPEYIDIPVGKVIQDHSAWLLNFRRKNETDPSLPPLTALRFPEAMNASQENIALFARGSGPLAQSGSRLEGWLDVANDDGSVRYFEIHANSFADGQVTLITHLTHGATSFGELGINAQGATYYIKNPLLADRGDAEGALKVFDIFLEYTRREGSVLKYDGPENTTAQDVFNAVSAFSGVHYVATTQMGTDDGRMGGKAVVDLDGKVYGMQNLFVVDAGIHPRVPMGNTQAITMVVAERVVERIMAKPL